MRVILGSSQKHADFGSTHVQYTQTDTNGQNTLTNRTIGKRLRFVKDALRFVPLERMVSSSFDRNSIGEMHLINTCKPCENEWSIAWYHWYHWYKWKSSQSIGYDSYHWNEW